MANWQLSSTINYTSGTWLTPFTGVDNSRTGVGNDRSDAVTIDTDLSRFFPLGETKKFEFRFEALNAINRPNFGLPTLTMTSAQFGRITGAGDPRILQFALKFWF